MTTRRTDDTSRREMDEMNGNCTTIFGYDLAPNIYCYITFLSTIHLGSAAKTDHENL